MIAWFQQHLAAIVGVALAIAFLLRWASNVARFQAKARVERAIHEIWPKLSRERKAAVLCVDGQRLADADLDDAMHRVVHMYRDNSDQESLFALAEVIRRNALAMGLLGEERRAGTSATADSRADRASPVAP